MPKRKCIFSEELKIKYKMFKPTAEPSEVKCELCDQLISIASKGKYDLEKHLNTEKHRKNIRTSGCSSKIDNFVTTRSGPKREVQAAEATLVFHTVKHNQSFNSLDCTVPLQKCLYADSNIAKEVTCARTKAEAILKNVLAPYVLKNILEDLSDIKYISASTDASNHGAIKLFPLLIQYFDYQKDGIQVSLIDIQSKQNETSETISNYVYDSLRDKNLSDKLVAFSADNAATNFGSKDRGGQNNVFFTLKSLTNNQNIIGVGCVAHIFNNSVHSALDSLPLCFESIVMQIRNHFATFTVRTEELKSISSELDIHFKQILYHSKTRWLSLFPAIERILQMFEPLKSYFLKTEKNNTSRTLREFFENDLNEGYLWAVHSFMAIYQNRIKDTEMADVSVNEVLENCSEIINSINARIEQDFCPLKVTSILRKFKENNENSEQVTAFKEDIKNMYIIAVQYLRSWTENLHKDTKHFTWMTLKDVPEWNQVSDTISILSQNNVKIDDSKCFDQLQNLKSFLNTNKENVDFKKLLAHKKWVAYFKSMISQDCFSEFLTICQYYFAIPGHNANVERVFSLIGQQWTKERNRLHVDTVAKMLVVEFNLKHLTCKDFYNYILKETELLKQVSTNQKY